MSESPYPQPGTAAPHFDLPSSDGKNLSLTEFANQTLVLYFYPKADTPGCTTQACGFRDSADVYEKAGVKVVGVSPDPIAKVDKFAKKYDLNFPLLADEDHALCEAYGVWQEKSMYGKKYMGAARTTFVIDGKGTIVSIFEKVKPKDHEQEVLAAIAAL